MSLGCNVAGRWGSCRATLGRALIELQRNGLQVVARSSLYRTRPVGIVRQPPFLNAVVGVEGAIGPAALLRLVKRIERAAGRRPLAPRGGPRPLDLDVLDFGSRRLGRSGRQRIAGRLLLPHPELAGRGFVLVPLAEVAPGWRQPRTGASAAALLKRRPGLLRGIARLADGDGWPPWSVPEPPP